MALPDKKRAFNKILLPAVVFAVFFGIISFLRFPVRVSAANYIIQARPSGINLTGWIPIIPYPHLNSVLEAELQNKIFSSVIMVSPPAGYVLHSQELFEWNSVANVTEYYVQLGTTLGGRDIFNSSVGTNPFVLISNIPQTGQSAYLRIWWKIGTLWSYKDFVYKAGGAYYSAAAQSANLANVAAISDIPENKPSLYLRIWRKVGTWLGLR